MFYFKLQKLGFTLIEIMTGILIVSIVMIGGFQALSSVNIGKVKLMSRVDLQKQIIYFQEKLFEEIKKGGLIDFEEYFNRRVVGTSFANGHYLKATGFGNFGKFGNIGTTTYGDSFYQCRSGDGILNKMTGIGCYNNNLNTYGADVVGFPQRYGEYSFQFIDYNSNFDADEGILGDEDGDLNIIGDDDDEYLGEGPIVFTQATDIKELYLISGDKRKRTLFRWKVSLDPNAPSVETCNIDASNLITGNGCIGTIEFLKLEGKDYGMDHIFGNGDSLEYDGIIDTWLIDKDFSGGATVVAGSSANNYRVPLFPSSINISNFKIFIYPNTDYDLSWKSSASNINISPYIRLNLTMGSSWEVKKKIKGNTKNINFSTSISLTDIFSK